MNKKFSCRKNNKNTYSRNRGDGYWLCICIFEDCTRKQEAGIMFQWIELRKKDTIIIRFAVGYILQVHDFT